MNTEIAIFNWKRRALKAEQQLRTMGHTRAGCEEWSDDEYLVATLEHKDGRPVNVGDVHAAQARIEQAKQ